ncbi:MAG: TIGR04255 family protein [Nitrospinota bacterium]
MLEKLKSPPLIEALCEFRFSATEDWDWTVPGRLYDELKDEFPERGQVQAIEVKFDAKQLSHRSKIDRVQMKRKDGSAMVQVGPHLLVINHLLPYSDWNNFLKLIINVLEKYTELATHATFKWIGLRYINQIPIKNEELYEIGRYIVLVPPIPKAIERPLASFYQRYELKHDNPEGVLIHQTGVAKSPSGQLNIMLDLDFVASKVSNLDKKAIGDWLIKAHKQIEIAFTESIESELLKKMKEGIE